VTLTVDTIESPTPTAEDAGTNVRKFSVAVLEDWTTVLKVDVAVPTIAELNVFEPAIV
jgi:hypothetical protein